MPADLSDHPYGHLGTGVTLDESLMTPADVAKREAMYKNHAFEEYISEMIPLNRTLPDYRGQWCKDQYDPQIGQLIFCPLSPQKKHCFVRKATPPSCTNTLETRFKKA